ncbi:unnamed protein product, partial [Durusdinium trenchii]
AKGPPQGDGVGATAGAKDTPAGKRRKLFYFEEVNGELKARIFAPPASPAMGEAASEAEKKRKEDLTHIDSKVLLLECLCGNLCWGK